MRRSLPLLAAATLLTGIAQAAPAASPSFAPLTAWVGKWSRPTPHGPSFWDTRALKPALIALIGQPRYAELMKALWQVSQVKRHDDWLVAQACLPHACSAELIVLFVDLRAGGGLRACWVQPRDDAHQVPAKDIWFVPGRDPVETARDASALPCTAQVHAAGLDAVRHRLDEDD